MSFIINSSSNLQSCFKLNLWIKSVEEKLLNHYSVNRKNVLFRWQTLKLFPFSKITRNAFRTEIKKICQIKFLKRWQHFIVMRISIFLMISRGILKGKFCHLPYPNQFVKINVNWRMRLPPSKKSSK